jgi:excisionase family DNA binding protein
MILQIPELAEELRISPRQVRRMINAGAFPFYKVGKRAIRLDLNEVKAAIRLQRGANDAKPVGDGHPA